MGIYLYDEALTAKIKSWTSSTDLHVYSPDDTTRLFEVVADTSNDEPFKLPLIAISRTSSFEISPFKQPLGYDGATTDASYQKSLQLNAIPIQLQYKIDVYTRYRREADEYVRNLLFNIINFPTLEILIPYNDKDIYHQSTLTLANSVEDLSNIPERLAPGQFTRYQISISVENAYLWDVRLRDNWHIEDVKLWYDDDYNPESVFHNDDDIDEY